MLTFRNSEKIFTNDNQFESMWDDFNLDLKSSINLLQVWPKNFQRLSPDMLQTFAICHYWIFVASALAKFHEEWGLIWEMPFYVGWKNRIFLAVK